MLRAQGLGGLGGCKSSGVSALHWPFWWADTTVRMWRNECRFLKVSFGVRTNIFPSVHVYRVCMATGPTFTESLLRSDSSQVGQNLWGGFILVENRERGQRERWQWERHKMKRQREKVNKGERKGRREEEIWVRERSSLSLSTPPPSPHLVTRKQRGPLRKELLPCLLPVSFL